MGRPSRIVRFLVVSDALSSADITEALGVEPDEANDGGSPRFPDQSSWELVVSGSGSDDLDELIARVLDRVRPLVAALRKLRESEPDIYYTLRVVQYIGPDPVGPGFALEADQMRVLVDVGASLDADQYWCPEPYE
jgi:Domain of unknown function (DUF4279)